MKIKLSCLRAMAGLALLAAGLSGCAHVPAQGGESGQAMAGKGQGSGKSSDVVDYRQVLSNPGPF